MLNKSVRVNSVEKANSRKKTADSRSLVAMGRKRFIKFTFQFVDLPSARCRRSAARIIELVTLETATFCRFAKESISRLQAVQSANSKLNELVRS